MPFWSKPKRETPSQGAEETRLKLEAEIQALKLSLQEREAELRAWRAQQEQEAARREAYAVARLEALFSDVAPPAAQLWLQGALIEQGQPVNVRDVWLVAQRLLTALSTHGLEVSDALGAEVAFDPNRHQALSGTCVPGARVRVRVPGLSYRGRVLVKAGVVSE